MRPKGIIKKSNEYAELFRDYNKIPKTIFAAVAVSFILKNNEENFDTINDLFYDEWEALHISGIIPQKPFRKQY